MNLLDFLNAHPEYSDLIEPLSEFHQTPIKVLQNLEPENISMQIPELNSSFVIKLHLVSLWNRILEMSESIPDSEDLQPEDDPSYLNYHRTKLSISEIPIREAVTLDLSSTCFSSSDILKLVRETKCRIVNLSGNRITDNGFVRDLLNIETVWFVDLRFNDFIKLENREFFLSLELNQLRKLIFIAQDWVDSDGWRQLFDNHFLEIQGWHKIYFCSPYYTSKNIQILEYLRNKI